MRALVAVMMLAGGTANAATPAPSPAKTLAPAAQAALAKAVANPDRSPANRARDRYRHPLETLSFFGVRSGDTVVEIWPGGGWYTEILAPYLASGGGTLYAAGVERQIEGVRKLAAADPARYGAIKFAGFPVSAPTDVRVPDGTADVVLTFRNVHNWRIGSRDDRKDYAPQAFAQAFAMLKPGGVLGVVDHRLPESASAEREKNSGYVKVSSVRKLAEDAGFRFVGASEVNANPRDTTEHPRGVWTLPPGLAMGEVDRDKYLAIGESDRMTLKFVKPAR